MENTQENRKIYGKKSAIIKFNNNVIENKDTSIILRTLIDNKTSQNVYIFVLNYTLNGIPYEVILGKLQLNKGAGNLSEKAKVIQEFVYKQISANNKGRNNYDFCSHLDNICVKKDIPFMYTEEGTNIVTNNTNEDKVMERTYFCDEENNILKLKCLKPEKRMDLYISKANIRKKIDENIKQNKAIEAAQNDLGPKMMEEFKLGKKLKDFKSEQSEEVIFSTRKALIEYLIQGKLQKRNEDKGDIKNKITIQEYLKIKKHYKEKENREVQIDPSMVIGYPPEETIEEKFFRLKEKAIAIDIKKMLEKEHSDYVENEINDEKNAEKESMRNANIYNSINNYKTIFDFIKQGKDLNTQFCYSVTPNGFKDLKAIVEKQLKKQPDIKAEEVEEILHYLKLKEEILENVKLNKGNGYLDLYDKNDKIKEFIEFVMRTNSRDYTRAEEKNILADVYTDMIDNMILRHEDAVKLYNGYASKFNAEICEIPNKTSIKTVPESPEDHDSEDAR